VLAGGAGRRLGGAKAVVELGGRPLLAYAVEALTAVLDDVVIVAKADSELPSLPGVPVWAEPDEVRHPALGIAHALAIADGRPVLVCAGDQPFVPPALVRLLAGTDLGEAHAVVPRHAGELQPLLALYAPAALEPLRAALDAPLRETVAALEPRLLEVDDPRPFFNVNRPEDLLHAAALLDRPAG
jgi:molybdopterin-guanine dinucleotide biosynthesis protein A